MARPELVDLPERLSLFGPTRVTSDQATVLAALAEHRDVHLWLPHPLGRPLGRDHAGRGRGRPASTPRRPHRGARPSPAALVPRRAARAQPHRREHHVTGKRTHHRGTAAPTRCSATCRATSAPTRPARCAARRSTRRALPVLGPDDRSVQVHACHGRHRQVEVLREVLLGLLADDPTLEPRDVLVMCPDIETFAPLIAAAFGLGATTTDAVPTPAHRLRVRLADRSLRQTNPLLAVRRRAARAGRRAGSPPRRCSTSPRCAPVRRRFGFDDDELERLARLGRRVRGALGTGRRAPRAVSARPASRQNTWRAGLDRLLLGVAMARGRPALARARRCPLDDVDSADIDLAGRFAELRRPARARPSTRSAGTQPLDDWLDGLRDGRSTPSPTRRPATPGSRRQARRRARPTSSRRRRRQAATVALRARRRARAARPTGCAAGRPGRASAPATLTVCTLVPMRSVPHRVVCLLGLDDGVFPRQTARRRRRRARRATRGSGERDPRSEDRQLLPRRRAAPRGAPGHHLHRRGRAHRRPRARPPCRSGELLDALDAPRRPPTAAACDQVVVTHPLQPFDARNFEAGALGRRGPFSFDPVGARRRPGGRRRPRRPRRRSCRRRCRRSTRRRRRARRPASASSSTRCGRSCGSGSGRRTARRTRTPTTRCPSSWTRCRSGRSATGCCAARLAGADRRRVPCTPSGAAAGCRRARSASALLDDDRPRGRAAAWPPARWTRAGAEPTALDIDVRWRRHAADGHRRRRARRRRWSRVDVLLARRQAPAARLGPAARADRRPRPARAWRAVDRRSRQRRAPPARCPRRCAGRRDGRAARRWSSCRDRAGCASRCRCRVKTAGRVRRRGAARQRRAAAADAGRGVAWTTLLRRGSRRRARARLGAPAAVRRLLAAGALATTEALGAARRRARAAFGHAGPPAVGPLLGGRDAGDAVTPD